jgi:hypothetical protein
MTVVYKGFSDEDLASLRWAHQHLEHPSFAARLSNLIGTPIEQGLKLLPQHWYRRLDALAERIILGWLDSVIRSMEHIAPDPSHDRLHRLLAMTSGGIGGFLGPVTLLAELPITTGLMLRSIADIAHSEGEDLRELEARIACMQVFALGGRSGEDQASETGYYGLRVTLGFHFSGQLLQLGKGTSLHNLPGGIELARAIALRFGVVISDSAAAKIIPMVGALTGALVNLAFMQHFQDIARAHFIVRRLERSYGSEQVRAAYELMEREEETARHYNPLEGW